MSGPLDIEIKPTEASCDFHDDHDPGTLAPRGNRCGAAAVAMIVWLDGSRRYSMACGRHIDTIDQDVPHRIERVSAN